MAREGAGKRGRGRRERNQFPMTDYDGWLWLLGFIAGAAISEAAVRVGFTRDGGALAIGIYAGDDYDTEYIKPDEDLAQAVREISLAWKIPVAVYDDTAGRWIVR